MTFSQRHDPSGGVPDGPERKFVSAGTFMSNAGRILVVEDNEVERRAISQILKAEGFTVFGAENADKALGYVEENVDVVLSDLHMGDVSGIDLLQLWKNRNPDTHFIVLTGHGNVDT